MIARIILFCKILVILVIRGEYLTPEDLTDLRGFILVILVIRGDMNALLFIISICQLLLTKVLAIAEADFV